jgi:DDE_Tnp_1-associated
MMPSLKNLPRKSRLAALLDHFAAIEDRRDVRRILHPLEVLLLVVCRTIADCDDYVDISACRRDPS